MDNGQWTKIYILMPDDKVIDEEIEDPIEHEVTSSAGCVTEELLRHDLTERRIEKIDDFSQYVCQFIHKRCKGTTFL